MLCRRCNLCQRTLQIASRMDYCNSVTGYSVISNLIHSSERCGQADQKDRSTSRPFNGNFQ